MCKENDDRLSQDHSTNLMNAIKNGLKEPANNIDEANDYYKVSVYESIINS